MRNRWFHKPLFHIHHEKNEKKVGWLELFYDLIFVASFIQLGNGLSKDISLGGFFQFSGVFLTLWLVWTGFTVYSNRFTVDDFLHRVLAFIQMFMVGGMALSAPLFLKGDSLFFTLTYASAQAILAVFFYRAHWQQKLAHNYSLYWGNIFAAGSVLWFITSIFNTQYNWIFWAAATVLVISAPLNKRSRRLEELYPMDHEHMSERFGLLTIIVLGESFVKVLSSLSETAAFATVFLQASVTLLLICSIWWIYFDDVADSELEQEKFKPIIWFFSHIPLQLSLIAIGVAIKKSLYLDLAAPMPDKYGWLLCGGLSLTFFSVAMIDSVTKRKDAELGDTTRVVVRTASGAMFLLLAAAGTTIQTKWFLGIVLVIAASQVVFDMIMAPFEHGHIPDESVSTADIAKARAANKDHAPVSERQTRNLEVIRKGTPNEFRKDFYFFLMEGSWARVFMTFGFLFFIINVMFAGLYVIRPGSISAARPDSFIDAFFFSIQTMSTIGYGSMSPVTTFGNVIVTMEVIVGLVSVALLTGLIFAKASRAKSSIIFSKNILINQRHGKRYLTFRAGNARGNDVIDATVKVNFLYDDISPEGEHLRRVEELKLERQSSPLFIMSWAVMHEIDDDSPLKNINLDDLNPNLVAFIVTLTGHDGTYGQTIYARHFYYTADVIREARFVDVLRQMPDGRFMIDYGSFHDTVPAKHSSS